MPYGLQSLPDCTGTTGDVGVEQVYPPPDLGQAPDHIIGGRFLEGGALRRLLVSGETQVRGGTVYACVLCRNQQASEAMLERSLRLSTPNGDSHSGARLPGALDFFYGPAPP